jgi:hypothetical protein
MLESLELFVYISSALEPHNSSWFELLNNLRDSEPHKCLILFVELLQSILKCSQDPILSISFLLATQSGKHTSNPSLSHLNPFNTPTCPSATFKSPSQRRKKFPPKTNSHKFHQIPYFLSDQHSNPPKNLAKHKKLE